MINILHIDSSIQGNISISKQYTKKVVEKIKAQFQNSQVQYLDLGENPVKLINGSWVTAAYIAKEKRTNEQNILLKESDELIEQVKKADCLVIGCPMYNFTISANLKSWIDNITRKWETFDENNNGMLFGKKIYLIMTRGGSNYEEGEKLNFLNGQTHSIVAPLSFIGMKDIKYIIINKCTINLASPEYQSLPRYQEAVKNGDKLVDELEI